MKINEMFNELENKVRDIYIVTLKYKYDFEENYTIENHILEYDFMNDSYVWLNDWNEGQTDIEVLGYMPIGDVNTAKQEPSEDAISREQAIRQCGFGMTSLLIADNLRKLPSVTPQQKIGRWIEEKNDYGEVTSWHCDKCYENSGFTTTCKWDFCPNCGAKMEVEE